MDATITEKQLKFIQTLREERDITSMAGSLHMNSVQMMSKQAASSLISHLLTMPKKAKEAPAEPVEPVEAGMYQLGEDIIRVRPSRGGRLYAQRLVVGDYDCGDCDNGIPCGSGCKPEISFVYVSGLINKVTAKDRMSLEDAQKFGRQFGSCCKCGRLLTNPDSIAAGIGPICAAGF